MPYAYYVTASDGTVVGTNINPAGSITTGTGQVIQNAPPASKYIAAANPSSVQTVGSTPNASYIHYSPQDVLAANPIQTTQSAALTSQQAPIIDPPAPLTPTQSSIPLVDQLIQIAKAHPVVTAGLGLAAATVGGSYLLSASQHSARHSRRRHAKHSRSSHRRRRTG